MFIRSGTNHKYKSTEAAFTVGGRIQEKFKWTAKMKNYDIEVPVPAAYNVDCCISTVRIISCLLVLGHSVITVLFLGQSISYYTVA
jgi:hypothetical protein